MSRQPTRTNFAVVCYDYKRRTRTLTIVQQSCTSHKVTWTSGSSKNHCNTMFQCLRDTKTKRQENHSVTAEFQTLIKLEKTNGDAEFNVDVTSAKPNTQQTYRASQNHRDKAKRSSFEGYVMERRGTISQANDGKSPNHRNMAEWDRIGSRSVWAFCFDVNSTCRKIRKSLVVGPHH